MIDSNMAQRWQPIDSGLHGSLRRECPEEQQRCIKLSEPSWVLGELSRLKEAIACMQKPVLALKPRAVVRDCFFSFASLFDSRRIGLM